MNQVDLHELDPDRLVNVLAYLFVEDGQYTEEEADARDKNRAFVLQNFLGYNGNGSYGRSNDELGLYSQSPRPYIPPTPQTEHGYQGLAPPLG